MKLFGSKKGGRHSVEAPQYQTSEEAVELEIPQAPAASVAPREEEYIPVIPGFAPPRLEEQETPAPAAPQDPEVGLITTIAEAVGVTAEIVPEPVEVEEPVQEPVEEMPQVVAEEPVKADRKADKKAAKADKKSAKAQAKEAKKAEKKAKKEAKKWSAGKKALVALLVVFALALTGGAGYVVSQLWQTEKDLGIYTPDYVEPDDDGEVFDPSKYSTSQENDGADAAPVDSKRKEGCYTFLVAGRDVQSGCTDVVIVGRLDTKEGTINMVSIPRDTLINKGLLKINTAYQGNLKSGGNGIDGLLKEVKKIVGFDIDSWAVVDTEAATRLIDAIGGVYFDVPIDMVYNDYAQDLFINIPKGYQLLNGEDAVKVLRFRKGYPNGDLGRIQTQHKLLTALADQVLDVKNIPNLGEAISIYQDCVHSNLSAGNLVYYATEFLKLDSENIKFHDMPQMMGGIVNNQSFIFINPDKWLKVINQYLNPYKEDITAQNLSIKTSADKGQNFYYTAGAGK